MTKVLETALIVGGVTFEFAGIVSLRGDHGWFAAGCILMSGAYFFLAYRVGEESR